MSVGFTRRWTYDPGNSVLQQIEGVDILDRAPPESINGVGSGTVNCVCEMENGPFNATTEVTSATQLAAVFGGFGYSYNGSPGQNVRLDRIEQILSRMRWAATSIITPLVLYALYILLQKWIKP